MGVKVSKFKVLIIVQEADTDILWIADYLRKAKEINEWCINAGLVYNDDYNYYNDVFNNLLIFEFKNAEVATQCSLAWT